MHDFGDHARLLRCPLEALEGPAHVSHTSCPSLQADVWEFFRKPSLYGQEILTQGGKRGPSRAFYLPSLSAMQLFLPAEAHEASGSDRPRHQIYSHEADWGPGWSPHMRPLAELFEQVSPCVISNRDIGTPGLSSRAR